MGATGSFFWGAGVVWGDVARHPSTSLNIFQRWPPVLVCAGIHQKGHHVSEANSGGCSLSFSWVKIEGQNKNPYALIRNLSNGDKRAPFEHALCSSWHLRIAWPFLGLVIAHSNLLSVEAIERAGKGMEGRRDVVKAKNLAENKVHVWKVHVCPLLNLTYHCGQKDYLPNLYSRRIN